jgi:hypothetical protein
MKIADNKVGTHTIFFLISLTLGWENYTLSQFLK